MKKLKIALVQMCSGTDPEANTDAALSLIRAGAGAGADLIATPEMTTLIDRTPGALRKKAVSEDGDPCLPRFAALARETGRHVLIGSMPVRVSPNRCANRSFLLGPDGAIKARYDKIHMFDVRLSETESYRESDGYEAGSAFVNAPVGDAVLGLTICYDLRFPHLYRRLAQDGANIISVPAAFTETTGRAHWHVLLRARAIETGCFIIAPAQSGQHQDGRQTYGHSLVVNPWGEVIAEQVAPGPGLLTCEIDLDEVDAARARIPSLMLDRDFGA